MPLEGQPGPNARRCSKAQFFMQISTCRSLQAGATFNHDAAETTGVLTTKPRPGGATYLSSMRALFIFRYASSADFFSEKPMNA